MSDYPPITLQNNALADGKYTDRNGCIYSVPRLIEHSKGLQAFDLPVAAVNIGANVFEDCTKNARCLAEHVKRVNEASFEHPVLMDPDGFIMDGWHRIVKALVEGRATVKAVRFETLPCYEYKETD